MNYFARKSLSETEFSAELARILIVDDSNPVTRVVVKYLDQAGYKDVLAINDSTRAVETIDQYRPDLIILDLIMPEIGGLEIMELIKDKPYFKDITILVFSAADKGTKFRSIRLGAAGFVDKPVSRIELVESVEAALKVF